MCGVLVDVIVVACVMSGALAAVAGYYIGRADGSKRARVRIVHKQRPPFEFEEN